jgi:putative flippase GtrA
LGITQNIVNIAGAAILTSVVTLVLLIYSLHELAIVVSMVTGQCIALIYAYCWNRGWEPLPRASRLEGTVP